MREEAISDFLDFKIPALVYTAEPETGGPGDQSSGHKQPRVDMSTHTLPCSL